MKVYGHFYLINFEVCNYVLTWQIGYGNLLLAQHDILDTQKG